jgi:lysophospholipid acyltransferase (LPLAT)-like uncharacterized protein
MLKRLGRSRAAQESLGALLAGYLGLVRRTNRFVVEPADFETRVAPDLPAICAMWHGQHFMTHFAWPGAARVAALISRHGDAELNAIVLRRLGVAPIRGSGGKARHMQRKGGVVATREMLRALADGVTVAMTADVPKRARVAGLGIVTLAQLSGRPIYPVAVATSRRFDFKSWDRASLGKPFGRGAIVIGEPVRVPAEADAATLERLRLAVQDGLDRAYGRAYELIGHRDPGAGLRPAAEPA